MPLRRRPPGDEVVEGAVEAADAVADAALGVANEIGDLIAPTPRRRIPSRSRVPSRELRRAAGRPAGPRGRRPSDRLQAAADSGLLTRSNTRPGTAGRRAVDRATYLRRQAGRPEGVTAREAVGQRVVSPAPPRTMSAIFRPPTGFAEVVGPTTGEARRIARWNARAAELVRGQISPERFRRLVQSWRPLGEDRFEWTPDAVLAILAERAEGGEATFVYRGRRGKR